MRFDLLLAAVNLRVYLIIQQAQKHLGGNYSAFTLERLRHSDRENQRDLYSNVQHLIFFACQPKSQPRRHEDTVQC